jgi:glycerol-3-phosphate O-acyltransferase / dihydroxyacetone phosphate acyltransferase
MPRRRWRRCPDVPVALPVVRIFARLAAWLFYRVDCVGAPPADGAVLLLPNHPNALLDPAVVWSAAGRDVRFLAKSTLFAGPFGPIVAGAGAIPVYRRADAGVDPARNAEMFAAVDRALASGDAVCIFPEGVSHSSGRLETLRTGAARIALGAGARGTNVALVPVGLNFDRKHAFRSRVIVAFGAPFSCDDLVEAWRADHVAAVRQLTDRIAASMRQLLVEADPTADAAIVDRVDRLYASARGGPGTAAERVARRRTIAAGIQRLRVEEPGRYEAALLELRRYDDRLRRFGVRDRHLDWDVSNRTAARFVAREAVFAIVLGPLCLAALLLFAVPYAATDRLARPYGREPDVHATAKLFAGSIAYSVWLLMLGAIVWIVLGPQAALVGIVILPIVAVAGLFAVERETAVIDAARAWLALRGVRDDTRERLKRRRSELATLLDEIYEWLTAARV